VGDTVCAARDGIVVGLIKDYNVGGKDRKYRDYANFITLYHTDGTFTQYVHLKKNGSFVALGDTVVASQPIGLAGITGFTSIPHVHFDALKPTLDGMVGFPIKFQKADGASLTQGMKVQH
jgi:murein DD-endopeptidase MepM/ murein hydrolase activator NlpD